jgi:hypothetical protein
VIALRQSKVIESGAKFQCKSSIFPTFLTFAVKDFLEFIDNRFSPPSVA